MTMTALRPSLTQKFRDRAITFPNIEQSMPARTTDWQLLESLSECTYLEEDLPAYKL
jgi:hypothetical protein